MIATSSRVADFAPAASYLESGARGEIDRDTRVDWTAARNLPIDEPQLAARIMQATAAQNVRVEKPVLHLKVSFDRQDRVTSEQMQHAADRILARLELNDHQTLIVAHKDREHPHVHLLVNRVHPETGKAAKLSFDWIKIQQVERAEEHALKLREVPGWLARLPEHPRPRTSRERRERVPAKNFRPPLVPKAPMESSRSLSAPSLTRPPDAPPDLQRLANAVRAVETARDAQAASWRASESGAALRNQLQAINLARERVAIAQQHVAHDLARTYQDPALVRAELERRVSAEGVEKATRAVERRPADLGTLRTEERQTWGGLVTERSDVAARNAAHQLAHSVRDAGDAERRLDQEVQRLRATRESLTPAPASPTVEAQRRETEHLGEAKARVAELSRDFDRSLERLYVDPASARVEFERRWDARGTPDKVAGVRQGPALLGELRPEWRGATPSVTLDRIKGLATEVAEKGTRALVARDELEMRVDRLVTSGAPPRVDRELRLARELMELEFARGTLLAARAVEGHAARQDLERAAGGDIARLDPRSRESLDRILTPAERLLAQELERRAPDRGDALGLERGLALGGDGETRASRGLER